MPKHPPLCGITPRWSGGMVTAIMGVVSFQLVPVATVGAGSRI
jgi:hypothetical protein